MAYRPSYLRDVQLAELEHKRRRPGFWTHPEDTEGAKRARKQRVEDLEQLIKRLERREREIRKFQPLVASLADHIRELQPRWAEGEECAVTPLMVADALEELGLDLRRDPH